MIERYSKAAVKAINAVVKKLVLAWDPDFTKVTPGERRALEQADRELAAGDYVNAEAINWN